MEQTDLVADMVESAVSKETTIPQEPQKEVVLEGEGEANGVQKKDEVNTNPVEDVENGVYELKEDSKCMTEEENKHSSDQQGNVQDLSQEFLKQDYTEADKETSDEAPSEVNKMETVEEINTVQITPQSEVVGRDAVQSVDSTDVTNVQLSTNNVPANEIKECTENELTKEDKEDKKNEEKDKFDDVERALEKLDALKQIVEVAMPSETVMVSEASMLSEVAGPLVNPPLPSKVMQRTEEEREEEENGNQMELDEIQNNATLQTGKEEEEMETVEETNGRSESENNDDESNEEEQVDSKTRDKNGNSNVEAMEEESKTDVNNSKNSPCEKETSTKIKVSTNPTPQKEVRNITSPVENEGAKKKNVQAPTTPTGAKKREAVAKGDSMPNMKRIRQKLKEVIESSKVEEDNAISELTDMKVEKANILKSITTEMESLKTLIKQRKQKPVTSNE